MKQISETETIAKKTAKYLLQINGDVASKSQIKRIAAQREGDGKFTDDCKLVELAIAEEREACIECAERWDGLVTDDSTVLSVREFITGERF